MQRRARLDRRVEIVAQRRAERGLKTLLDLDEIDDRRPQVLGVHMQHFCERLRLGLEPVRGALGLGERLARHIERLPGARMGGFRAHRHRFRLGDCFLRGRDGGREGCEIDLVGSLGLDALELRGDSGHLALDAPAALVVSAHGVFQLVAPGGEVGEGDRELRECLFGRRHDGVGLRDTRVDAGAALGGGGGFALQAILLGLEAGDRGLGVGGKLLLARDVLVELHDAPVELGHALLRPRFLALERLARDHQALQGGGFARLRLAQRRQAGGGNGLQLGRLGLRAGTLGDRANAHVLGVLGVRDLAGRVDEAQMMERRLGLAHVLRDIAVAHGLARLALERVHLAGELVDDVLEAGEVLLGGAQAQLRLVAARMQAGNAGGFFQHAAALLGLRLDDLADAALVHQGRRAGAGRGVGEQELDVAGAHLAAVDAIERALVALDPPRDFEVLLAVELGRRAAVAVVDRHRHLGGVARRPAVVAGEDDVIHVDGAHGLVRGLAHDPAQRLDQVRLAAAVRPDHAGQPRLDQEVGSLDEGLEAEKPQSCQFHEGLNLGPYGRINPH